MSGLALIWIWAGILVVFLLTLALRKGLHDLEDIVAGLEERMNRRLTYLEQNQKHK